MYTLWFVFCVVPAVLGLIAVYGGVWWAANDATRRGVSPIVAGVLVGVFLPIGLPIWLLFRPQKLKSGTSHAT